MRDLILPLSIKLNTLSPGTYFNKDFKILKTKKITLIVDPILSINTNKYRREFVQLSSKEYFIIHQIKRNIPLDPSNIWQEKIKSKLDSEAITRFVFLSNLDLVSAKTNSLTLSVNKLDIRIKSYVKKISKIRQIRILLKYYLYKFVNKFDKNYKNNVKNIVMQLKLKKNKKI